MKIVVSTPQVAGYLDSVRHAAPDDDVVEVLNDEALLGEVVDAEILFTSIFGEFAANDVVTSTD